MRHENFDKYDLSSLRVALTSGAKIAPERLKQIVAALGLKHFMMAYGQTECSPLVTTTMYDDGIDVATKTDGRPLPTVSVRIWDTEKNIIKECGETGEIQVCGNNVMKCRNMFFRLVKCR